MQLKKFQEEAVDDLISKSKKLLRYKGKKLVFKSPTGSGKTIMMAEFLKRISEDSSNYNLSYIWAAPWKLHLQSKDKLEKYYDTSSVLTCHDFFELNETFLKKNQILFVNWESINKENNIIRRDNELKHNLSNLLQNTLNKGVKIILIIDESHQSAGTNISKEIISLINPSLTIDVSATPTTPSPDETVTVYSEDVRSEGLIKEEIVFQDGLTNVKKGKNVIPKLEKTSDEFILDYSLKKFIEIQQIYKKEKINVKPLFLIQLPDEKKKSDQEESIRNKIIFLLNKKYKINVKNGKLAIHLTGQPKKNLSEIKQNLSKVEVLIFKKAVALGWDCPRAQVLLIFRVWKNFNFSIQTLGRIMRMPIPKIGHFKNKILNKAYVFTNLNQAEINEDLGDYFFTILQSKRKKFYSPLNLQSCHSVRQREITRLSPLFIKLFLKEASNYKLANKLSFKKTPITLNFMSQFISKNIDELKGKKVKTDYKLEVNDFELQNIFNIFVEESLSPEFYPEQRSIDKIKSSIYEFFKEYVKKKLDEQIEILKIIFNNVEHFKNVINNTKHTYKQNVTTKDKIIEFDNKWNIPEVCNFDLNADKINVKKSIMSPFLISNLSTPEYEFIKYLDKSKKVLWWYKNADSGKKNFAIPYKDENQNNPFYVDFIIMYNNKKLALIDTKSGITIEIAKPKILGMRSYISKNRKISFGAIVSNVDSNNFKKSWVYFNGQDIKFFKDISKWKILRF